MPTQYAEEAEDTFDETALDSNNNKGTAGLNRNNASTVTTHAGLAQRKARLSVRSQQYDIDGDGKLDDIEQAMRDMDSKALGHLSNEKVYQILQQQMKTQKELFNMKRLVVVFGVFTLILALSNLGTAFAAARLAKDTQVTADGILVTTDGAGQVVSTHVESKIFDLISADERRLDLVDGGSTAVTSGDSLSFSDAKALYERCMSSSTTYIRHSCGDVTETIPICGPGANNGSMKEKATGPQPKSHTWTCLGGDVVIGACTSSQVCPVVFANTVFECGDPVSAPTPAPVTPVPTPAPVTPVPTPAPVMPTRTPVEVFLTPAPIATRPPR